MGADAMTRRVTLVNTNQVKPAVAPIAYDYLHEPLSRAGFQADLLDLCFSQDVEMDIEKYCRHNRPDFWGVTLRNTDDVHFSSQYSLLDVIWEMVAALLSVFLTRITEPYFPVIHIPACGLNNGNM
jgi:tryptophan 2-C-methyltransferase